LFARLSNGGTAGKELRGICNTPGGVILNGWGEVRLLGLINTFAGLSPGTIYYNSNSPGLISSTTGTISQKVGYALSPTQLFLNPAL
jgi:hypothetical protein